MKKDLSIFDFLAQIPWWVSVSLSLSFYLIFQYAIPYFESQSTHFNEIHVSLGPVFAPVVALALLSPVTFSFFKKTRKKKLHNLREEIGVIQELELPQFQEYVAEAYNRAGYMILKNDPRTSSQEIDLLLRKGANLYLLQARYWRNRKLGKREVKKLFLLMHEKQASGVFILTTGIFTREARRYAVGRPINLVDGIRLVEMLYPIIKNSTAPVYQ